MERYLLLAIGWTIYFIVHSALADDSVKNYSKRMLGNGFRFYRLFYVLISSGGLLYLIYYNAIIDNDRILESGFFILFGYVWMSLGAMVIFLSFKDYSLRGFLGLKLEDHKLKTDGLLAYVRHPIYLGTVLIVIGYWFVSPYLSTLVSVTCIFVYLAIGIQLEEKKLIKAFGESYVKYKKKVPMIFPRIRT